MRIAIVAESWLPSTNGVVTRLQATITELQRQGHHVMIIAPGPGDDGFAGSPVKRAASIGFRFIYGGERWGLPTPRVGRWLREFRPDVIHVVNPILLGIAAVIAARRTGTPLVASYHTNVPAYARYYHLGWLRPTLWALLRWMHNQAEINLATAAGSCEELRRQRVRRVHHWRRGVDLDRFHPPDTTGEPRGTPAALYVGRLAGEKGVDRLLPLARSENGIALCCVGDGPDRDRVRSTFAGTATRFTGKLSGTALVAEYHAADVFVFPSTTDTLGLVMLEALACGLPVVAADTPGSREVLRGCPVARLFPADDPAELLRVMREVLASAPRQELAATARSFAQPWGWRSATDQLLGYYRQARAVSRTAAPSLVRQLRTFLLVGAGNAFVDLMVFNALLAAGPTRSARTLVLYNTIAVAAAITNSYLWNRRVTFASQRRESPPSPRRERIGFLAQALANLLVNNALLLTASALLGQAGLLPAAISSNLAKIIAMLGASLLSFAALRSLVYRGPHAGRAVTTNVTESGRNDVR